MPHLHRFLNSAMIVHKAHVICVFLEKTTMRLSPLEYSCARQSRLTWGHTSDCWEILQKKTHLMASQAEQWCDNLRACRCVVEGYWVVCAAVLSKLFPLLKTSQCSYHLSAGSRHPSFNPHASPRTSIQIGILYALVLFTSWLQCACWAAYGLMINYRLHMQRCTR